MIWTFSTKKIGEDGPQSPRGLTVRTGPEFLPRGGLSRSTLATIVLHSAHCAIGSSAPRRTDGRLGPVCCMELLHKFLKLLGLKIQIGEILGLKNEKSLLMCFLGLLAYINLLFHPTTPTLIYFLGL